MSSLPSRGSIALAALLAALLSSRAAEAQQVVVVVPSPKPMRGPGHPLITGVAYDVWNQGKAEQRLDHLQDRYRRDAERGDSEAMARDAWRIDNTRYRIVVDEWLIRKNSLCDPGCYPLRIDCESNAALAEVARPAPELDPFRPSQSPGPTAAPAISVAIDNTGAPGSVVSFTVDGGTYQLVGGVRQNLVVAPDAIIRYDGGSSIGPRSYRVVPGLYEFRSSPEGWLLYKLPDVP